MVNEAYSEMNMGTYNYYGPSQADLHATCDVAKWLQWGNTKSGWIWTDLVIMVDSTI